MRGGCRSLPRPPSFRTSLTLVFDTCSAGARPKRMPVSDADAGEEAEDGAVHRELDPVGLSDVHGDRAVEQADAAERQQQPERAADARRAGCSRRAAVGSPATASRRARCERAISRERCAARDEQQVRDVRAGDEQDEADRAHHGQEDLPIGPPLNRSLKVWTSAVGNSLFVSGYCAASRPAMPSISV